MVLEAVHRSDYRNVLYTTLREKKLHHGATVAGFGELCRVSRTLPAIIGKSKWYSIGTNCNSIHKD